MEGSMIDLSKSCFQSAKEDLEAAQLLMKDGRFKASVNFSMDFVPSQLWQNLILVNILA